MNRYRELRKRVDGLSKYVLGACAQVLASGRAMGTEERVSGAARRLWRLRGGPEPWLQVRGQSWVREGAWA
jgi:hypothetical protein